MSCHCEALDCAVRSHLVLHAWVMTAQLMQFITADACHWFCCASGSSVLAFNISSLWPLQLVWINGLFGFLMIWPLQNLLFVYLYRYSHLVPSLQMMQFSAAAGLSRLLIILGVLKPVFQGGDVSEELIQRQVSPQTPSEPTDMSWIKLASV